MVVPAVPRRGGEGPLLIWGDVGFDDYEGGPTLLGGCALNVARAFAAASAEVPGPAWGLRVAAPLGEDGGPLRAALEALGADTSLVVTRPGSSPRQPIRLDSSGERTLSGYRAGVLGAVSSEDISAVLAEYAGLTYVPTFTQTQAWAEAALESGAPVALDLMDLSEVTPAFVADAARRATLIFCGLSETHPRLRELRELAQAGGASWIVTLGPGGALWWEGAAEERIAAAPVPGQQVRDTTGCGDTFAGTFLAGWRSGEAPASSLERASAAAARVAARLGTA